MLIRTDSICIIAICSGDVFTVICGNKLSALPTESIITKDTRISDSVIGYQLPVVSCQQIAPIGIAVGIIYSFKNSSESSRCERITLLRRDITGIIVRVRIAITQRSVILSCELTEIVVRVLILNNSTGILNLRYVSIRVVSIIIRNFLS